MAAEVSNGWPACPCSLLTCFQHFFLTLGPDAQLAPKTHHHLCGCRLRTAAAQRAPLCSPFCGCTCLPSLIDCLVTADLPACLGPSHPPLSFSHNCIQSDSYNKIPFRFFVVSLLPDWTLTDTRRKKIRSKCEVFFFKRALFLSKPFAFKVVKGKCLVVDKSAKTFLPSFCGLWDIMRCPFSYEDDPSDSLPFVKVGSCRSRQIQICESSWERVDTHMFISVLHQCLLSLSYDLLCF